MRRVCLIAAGLLALAAPGAARAADCTPADTAVQRYVPFQNRFGETIAVDLYLPADASGRPLTEQGCRYPVVLESSPYRDWTTPQPTKTSDDARREWWVGRGYVYAFADVPGAGGSDGTWCLFCRHEQLSGYDMVEALARRPWSTGKVGMIGGSYPAITALLVAQLHPPHLRAVIAANFMLDPYRDFFYVGGMRRFEDATALMLAYTGLSRWTGRYTVEDPQRSAEVWRNRLTAPPPDFVSAQDEHPLRDAWYAEREIHPERIDVPAYLVGGWNDMFDDPTWRAYDRLAGREKYLLQGPFTHVPLFMPPGAWPCDTHDDDFCGAALFDHALKGAPAPAWPRVRSYVEPAFGYVSGAGKPRTTAWSMALGAAGETRTLRYDPASGATSGQWFLRGSVPGTYPPFDSVLGVDGPADQRVEEQSAVSFESAPLARDTTLLGGGTLRLRIVPQSSDAFVVARVVDEVPPGSASFPHGYATLVTNGWLLASHRDGDTAAAVKPLVPGRAVTLDVPIWPAGYRFAKGDRIRLDLYSSDTPRFVPPRDGSDVTIDAGASSLRLPVLP